MTYRWSFAEGDTETNLKNDRKSSNIRRTETQNLNVSYLVLQ